MRVTIFSLLFFAGLLLGCSSDDLDPVMESTQLQSEVVAKSSRKVHRPIKLTGEGAFSITLNTSACPGLAQLTIDGGGQATHLGNFEVSLIWCTDRVSYNSATGTMVAANGDELRFNLIEYGMDAEGEWATYEFDGGTGRFDGASGELHERIYSTFIDEFNAVYTNTATGWISY